MYIQIHILANSKQDTAMVLVSVPECEPYRPWSWGRLSPGLREGYTDFLAVWLAGRHSGVTAGRPHTSPPGDLELGPSPTLNGLPGAVRTGLARASPSVSL